MGAVVGGDYIVKNLLSNLLLCLCAVLELVIISRLLRSLHAGVDVDIVCGIELDSALTDVGGLYAAFHGCPLLCSVVGLSQGGFLVKLLWAALLGRFQQVDLHDVGRLEGCLTCGRNDARIILLDTLDIVFTFIASVSLSIITFIADKYILADEVAHAVITLTQQAAVAGLQPVGRTVVVVSLIIIFCGALLKGVCIACDRRIPFIPYTRIVHVVGQDIARSVCQVVRRAEHELVINVFLLVDMIDLAAGRLQRIVFTWQQHGALRIGDVANLTVGYGDVGLFLEEASLRRCQHIPVPVADGVVQLVGHIVDDHLLAFLQGHAGRRIVGVEILLHLHQRHLAVRGCGDGERYVYRLTVGVGGTGVG